METIKKELELPKESFELADGISNMVLKVKDALADGWQTGTDLPVLVTAAITELVKAVEGIDKVSGEMKESPYKFGLSWAVAGEKVFDGLIKQTVVEV